MPSPINIPVYSDALVLLGTAGIVIPLVRRFGFNPVLGYLVAGAILGPLGLGSYIGQFPFLYWFTVVDAKNVAGIADLGIVFLLFLIGMELSYERLKTMRRLVFGLGSLQIVFSAAAIGAAVILAGGKPPVPLLVGACLALSSTAIVVDVLSRQGLLLAETEFRKAIETAIDPFKGLLLGLFFFTVGMKIDFRELARDPVWLLGSIVGLIAAKSIILIALARLFRLSWRASIETGLLLGPGGEFAFVAIGMATILGLIDAKVSSFTVALTSLTMMLIPALSHVARRLTPMVREDKPLDPELTIAPSGGANHAIVIGHGRVGQVVCTMLDRHKFQYIAVDNDAAAVPEQRRQGRTVYYGDATNPEFLKSCGLMEAAAVIVTIGEAKGIDEIVAQVRVLRQDMLVVSRARDADHARHLYQIGVTDAVPETIEASLLLSEAALIGLGVAMGLVVASIHEKREEFRHELQQAAGSTRPAGETSGVRRKPSH